MHRRHQSYTHTSPQSEGVKNARRRQNHPQCTHERKPETGHTHLCIEMVLLHDLWWFGRSKVPRCALPTTEGDLRVLLHRTTPHALRRRTMWSHGDEFKRATRRRASVSHPTPSTHCAQFSSFSAAGSTGSPPSHPVHGLSCTGHACRPSAKQSWQARSRRGNPMAMPRRYNTRRR